MNVATMLFDDELPARPSSLCRLRHRFRNWLEPAVRDTFTRNDIVLTMSELAAATLRGHERGVAGDLHARAWMDDDSIVLEVVDGHDDHAGDEQDERRAEPGTALSVVASLVDVLSVRERDGKMQVRARIDLPARLGGLAVSP